MNHIGYYFGVSKQIEILFLTLFGICYTFFDSSMSELNSNLRQVWELEMDDRKISELTQFHFKYVLCGIVLAKSCSVHINLTFYLVMLWPIIFEERPVLFIPWLILGAIKYIAISLVTLLCGIFTCIAYNGFSQPSCLDFLIALIIDYTPSYYMWLLVLSFYKELKKFYGVIITLEPSKSNMDSEITIRRRKVRSMADNIPTRHHCQIDEDRQLISVSTIENIVQQLTTDLHRKTTRSLDSLLGVKAAEAEKAELMNWCEELPADETGLTIQEKTLKLFRLTSYDVALAKQKLEKTDLMTKSLFNIREEVKETNDINNTDGSDMVISPDIRFTQSENVDTELNTISELKTNFMADFSETEIRSVLNYSSTCLLPSARSKNLKSCCNVTTSKHTINKKKSSILTSINKNVRPKMSDFSCQASTLSRSILKTPPAELIKYIRPKVSSKKISVKSPLVKSIEDKFRLLKSNATEMEGHYKLFVGSDLITTLEDEEVITHSSFKSDGYAMAYRKKETIDKNLIRIAKDVLLRRLRSCTRNRCEN